MEVPKTRTKHFFLMPTNRSMSSAWKRAINRTELPKQVFVCSDHFEESCFNQSWTLQCEEFYKQRRAKPCLTPGSIPTIFPQKQKDTTERPCVKRRASRRDEEERVEVRKSIFLGSGDSNKENLSMLT